MCKRTFLAQGQVVSRRLRQAIASFFSPLIRLPAELMPVASDRLGLSYLHMFGRSACTVTPFRTTTETQVPTFPSDIVLEVDDVVAGREIEVELSSRWDPLAKGTVVGRIHACSGSGFAKPLFCYQCSARWDPPRKGVPVIGKLFSRLTTTVS